MEISFRYCKLNEQALNEKDLVLLTRSNVKHTNRSENSKNEQLIVPVIHRWARGTVLQAFECDPKNKNKYYSFSTFFMDGCTSVKAFKSNNILHLQEGYDTQIKSVAHDVADAAELRIYEDLTTIVLHKREMPNGETIFYIREGSDLKNTLPGAYVGIPSNDELAAVASAPSKSKDGIIIVETEEEIKNAAKKIKRSSLSKYFGYGYYSGLFIPVGDGLGNIGDVLYPRWARPTTSTIKDGTDTEKAKQKIVDICIFYGGEWAEGLITQKGVYPFYILIQLANRRMRAVEASEEDSETYNKMYAKYMELTSPSPYSSGTRYFTDIRYIGIVYKNNDDIFIMTPPGYNELAPVCTKVNIKTNKKKVLRNSGNKIYTDRAFFESDTGISRRFFSMTPQEELYKGTIVERIIEHHPSLTLRVENRSYQNYYGKPIFDFKELKEEIEKNDLSVCSLPVYMAIKCSNSFYNGLLSYGLSIFIPFVERALNLDKAWEYNNVSELPVIFSKKSGHTCHEIMGLTKNQFRYFCENYLCNKRYNTYYTNSQEVPHAYNIKLLESLMGGMKIKTLNMEQFKKALAYSQYLGGLNHNARKKLFEALHGESQDYIKRVLNALLDIQSYGMAPSTSVIAIIKAARDLKDKGIEFKYPMFWEEKEQAMKKKFIPFTGSSISSLFLDSSVHGYTEINNPYQFLVDIRSYVQQCCAVNIVCQHGKAIGCVASMDRRTYLRYGLMLARIYVAMEVEKYNYNCACRDRLRYYCWDRLSSIVGKMRYPQMYPMIKCSQKNYSLRGIGPTSLFEVTDFAMNNGVDLTPYLISYAQAEVEYERHSPFDFVDRPSVLIYYICKEETIKGVLVVNQRFEVIKYVGDRSQEVLDFLSTLKGENPNLINTFYKGGI